MLIGEVAIAALIRGAAAHEAQVRQYDVSVATRKRHRPFCADLVRKHREDLLAVLKPRKCPENFGLIQLQINHNFCVFRVHASFRTSSILVAWKCPRENAH